MAGGLQATERMEMIQGRVWARELLVWIFDRYEMEGPTTLREIYWKYLAHQLKTLCQAKHIAEKEEIFAYHGKANGRQVKKNIVRSFAGVKEFWDAWDKLQDGGKGALCYETDSETSLGSDSENEPPMRPLVWSLNDEIMTYKRPIPLKCNDLGTLLLLYLELASNEVISDFSRPPGYTSDDVEWVKPNQGRGDDQDTEESDSDPEEGSVNESSLSTTHRRKRQKRQ
jgi:hypothetical protein